MNQESSAKLDGYNHIIKKFELSGFYLTEAIYPPKFQQSRHTHEIPHISFTFQGSFTERHLGKSLNCEKFSLIFRPWDLTHSLNFGDAETRIFSIEIKPRWFDYICEKPDVLNRPANFNAGLPVCFATRLFTEYRRGDFASMLTMEGLVLEMIAAANGSAAEYKRESSRWFKQTRDFLRTEFAKNLTIEDIAKTAGVHPVHLARVFREQMGYTIGEYVRRLRVEFASHQLASTNASLGEIAAEAGFADQSHFSRTFKNYLGVTPGEYRKSMRSR
jgi:AraC family transcriptional regulator